MMSHRTGGFFDNPIHWAFRLGRWFGVEIRIHFAFLVAGVVMLAGDGGGGAFMAPSPLRHLGYALGGYLLLFVLVLLHEFGHCFGARAVGGEADEILLWPLGGLAFTRPPHHPTAHLVTVLAGPTVNVLVCAATSLALVSWMGRLGAVPWNPLDPFSPSDPSIRYGNGQAWLARTFGLSYLLLLFNLLPIFPFDGGRIVQAWLWNTHGYREATRIAAGIGMVGAIVLGFAAVVFLNKVLLFLIAVFGYVECYGARHRLPAEEDESAGEWEPADRAPPGPPGWWERFRGRRLARKTLRDRRRRERREAKVERILAKISQLGISSLTSAERRLLQSETKRRQVQDSPTSSPSQ
jgi:Zn-dependent protease